MTDTGTLLMTAILDDPDDLVLRGAYADWCEENGKEVRADEIRRGLAGEQWSWPFEKPTRGVMTFVNGFTEMVKLPLSSMSCWHMMLACSPLRKIEVLDRDGLSFSFRKFLGTWQITCDLRIPERVVVTPAELPPPLTFTAVRNAYWYHPEQFVHTVEPAVNLAWRNYVYSRYDLLERLWLLTSEALFTLQARPEWPRQWMQIDRHLWSIFHSNPPPLLTGE